MTTKLAWVCGHGDTSHGYELLGWGRTRVAAWESAVERMVPGSTLQTVVIVETTGRFRRMFESPSRPKDVVFAVREGFADLYRSDR